MACLMGLAATQMGCPLLDFLAPPPTPSATPPATPTPLGVPTAPIPTPGAATATVESTFTETPEPASTETPEPLADTPTPTDTPAPPGTNTPRPTDAPTVPATETPEPTSTETPEPPADTPTPTPTVTLDPTPTALPTLTIDLGGGVTMDLVRIPAGSFVMGSPESDSEHQEDEQPQRTVNISGDFWMGRTEVTQAQWRAVMGTDPSSFTGDDLPVEQVSWDDCQQFCTALSQLSGLAIRLPTEGEWEYACRAGTATRFSFGDDMADLGSYGWYANNSSARTHDVAGKLPNAWGLYDVHGNVWEFCSDRYSDSYYGERPDPDTDPSGPASGIGRTVRGGAWGNNAGSCRSAYRWWFYADVRHYRAGIRVVAETQGPTPTPTATPVVPTPTDAATATETPEPPADTPTPTPTVTLDPTPTALPTLTIDLGGGVTMDLVRIPAGSFVMGSPESDSEHQEDEQPQRTVNISGDFWMGRTEVTQAQWRAVMGTDPSSFTGDDLPVEQVSWDDCQQFCTALSQLSGLAIRLPTEGEWEYACRAGTATRFSFGDDMADLGSYGWYANNSSARTHDVAGKLPNAWGLYDVHGNVWEFCSDRYSDSYYGERPDPDTDPSGPASGTGRTVRGGAWGNNAGSCRSAYRWWFYSDFSHDRAGIRVAAGTQ